VTQINKAMGQVDQVTQRNASSAEELSSTAEQMASQSESLAQLMGFFKTSGGDAGFAFLHQGAAKNTASGQAHAAPALHPFTQGQPVHPTDENWQPYPTGGARQAREDLAKGHSAGI
jgi:methyl-accepting chemotaxis protein